MRNGLHDTAVPCSSDPLAAAWCVADIAYALAPARDADGSVPDTEIAALAAVGLLHAPLPAVLGGQALGATPATTLPLRDVLRVLGGASLPLGRLYEGHVNAVRLVMRYGTPHQLRLLGQEADARRLSAVWNAESGDGLHLVDGRLRGGKIYTSGVGMVRRPLLTATTPAGVVMLLPDVAAIHADLSGWTPLGMRASLTGAADFSGLAVAPDEIVGVAGDYYRAPLFSGGAWRVIAVQLGAVERLVALYADQMQHRGRAADAVQRARFAEAVTACEAARLWTARAAMVAEDARLPAGEIDAFVNLARHGFERAAIDVMGCVQRGVGLSAMLRPSPIERIVRDLTTYLRQPGLDAGIDAAAGWALADRAMHADIGTA